MPAALRSPPPTRPPASPRTSPGEPSPAGADAGGTPGGYVVLRGVPWSLYEQLLDVVGDGLPRMTYDDGTLG